MRGWTTLPPIARCSIFEDPGERVITIMTAGSLSVTQTTIARLREAIEDPDATEETSIMKAPTMLKVADDHRQHAVPACGRRSTKSWRR